MGDVGCWSGLVDFVYDLPIVTIPVSQITTACVNLVAITITMNITIIVCTAKSKLLNCPI